MDEFTVQPDDVRAGGNILESRSIADFGRYQSKVTRGGTGSPTGESFVLTYNNVTLQCVLGNNNTSSLETVINTAVRIGCTVSDGSIKLSGKTVKFYKNGSTLLGSGSTNSNGWAQISYTPSVAGSETITAVYEGDSTYGETTSNACNLVINKKTTSVTLNANNTNLLAGESLTLSGTCSLGSGVSIELRHNGVVLTTLTTGANGTFSKTVTGLTAGQHTFAAFYNGDNTNAYAQSDRISVYVDAGVSFNINSNGHLILTTTGNPGVTFSINNQGHLIVTGTNEEYYSINSNGHCIYGE